MSAARSTTDAEVLIVGGGPVGLAAAIEARLAGLEATVVEPRSGSIDKACGEGLMPGALPLLGRLGVVAPGMALRGVRYTDGMRSVEHRFSGSVGLGVRRLALHTALADRARELGVAHVEGRLEGLDQDDDGVDVALADGSRIRARWVVGADGLHSRVATLTRLARPSPSSGRRFGIRRHYRVEPWSELIEVHWSTLGELYVTPVADRVVGIAVLARQGTGFGEVLDAVPEVAQRLSSADPMSAMLGAGPFRQRTTRRVRGRVLLVGDASGYVDAITGEGLRLGFAQAHAAVARIAAAGSGAGLGSGSAGLDGYERDWREVTRDFRRLTGALVRAAESPLRRGIVPAAVRLPRVFGHVVERLAR